MIKIGFQPNVCLDAKIVSMYDKFGCIEDACQMFDKMHAHNLVSWTSMVARYAQHCYGEKASSIYFTFAEYTIINEGTTFGRKCGGVVKKRVNLLYHC